MPRATKSKIGEVVGFFRGASLEVMDVAFDLVKDVVGERRGKSEKAKARAMDAGDGASTIAAAAPVVRKKAKATGAKRGRKRKIKELGLVDLVKDVVGEASETNDTSAPLQTMGAPA